MGVREPETEIGGNPRGFASTLWTVVLSAKDDSKEALEKLIETYWKPAYFYVRRRGEDPETAKDLTQGFFAALIERNFLQYVDRERGKFRTFLLTALDHFLTDEARRDKAEKRGGGRAILSLDFQRAETEYSRHPESPDAPDRIFARQWALRVTGRALQALREEFEAAGRADEFEAFRLHLTLGAASPPSIEEVAGKMGISEDAAKVRIHRARRRYRDAILREVRATTGSDEEAREELKDLFSAFEK